MKLFLMDHTVEALIAECKEVIQQNEKDQYIECKNIVKMSQRVISQISEPRDKLNRLTITKSVFKEIMMLLEFGYIDNDETIKRMRKIRQRKERRNEGKK